jgi:hypothetical protein
MSVTAIGMLLLHFHLPWFAAFPVAAVFDGLWIWALHTEWLADTNRRARIAAQVAGLLFMAVSSFAIWMEGGVLHAAAGVTAVAAAVPLAVKAAWWLRFLLVAPRLSRALSTRLEKELGRKVVEYRVKEAELQGLALDAKIVAAKLALEPAEVVTAEQEFPEATPAETESERAARELAGENRKLRRKLKRLSRAQPVAQPAPLQLSSAQPVLSLAQPVQPVPGLAQPSAQAAQPRSGQRVEPPAQPFGFSAQPSAQATERLSRVAQVAELLTAEPGLSGAQLAQRTGWSLASAKRYLSDARKTN